MKTILVNQGEYYHVTCILNNEVLSGKIFAQQKNEFLALKTGNPTKEEVTRFFVTPHNSKYVNYAEFITRLREWNHPYLEFINNRIVYKGIPIAIPEALCEKMAVCNKLKDLNALCNFWRNLALCPEPRVRDGLFEYLQNNGFIITNEGMIVSLRRVKSNNSEKRCTHYIDFVTESYYKIKRQKKSPKKYAVIEGDDEMYKLIPNEDGYESLEAAYNNLIESPDSSIHSYLAAHNSETTYFINGQQHYGRVEYKLLHETRLHRADCDHDASQHCSQGLHLGTPDYVKHNGWLGDVIMVCLSNPMDAVSVPEDGYMKFRTSALYPIAIINESEIDSFNTNAENPVEIFDTDYLNYSLEYIENLIKTSRFETLKEDFIIPREMSSQNVEELLAQIKQTLLNR
jgi:hypothetical protein